MKSKGSVTPKRGAKAKSSKYHDPPLAKRSPLRDRSDGYDRKRSRSRDRSSSKFDASRFSRSEGESLTFSIISYPVTFFSALDCINALDRLSMHPSPIPSHNRRALSHIASACLQNVNDWEIFPVCHRILSSKFEGQIPELVNVVTQILEKCQTIKFNFREMMQFLINLRLLTSMRGLSSRTSEALALRISEMPMRLLNLKDLCNLCWEGSLLSTLVPSQDIIIVQLGRQVCKAIAQIGFAQMSNLDAGNVYSLAHMAALAGEPQQDLGTACLNFFDNEYRWTHLTVAQILSIIASFAVLGVQPELVPRLSLAEPFLLSKKDILATKTSADAILTMFWSMAKLKVSRTSRLLPLFMDILKGLNTGALSTSQLVSMISNLLDLDQAEGARKILDAVRERFKAGLRSEVDTVSTRKEGLTPNDALLLLSIMEKLNMSDDIFLVHESMTIFSDASLMVMTKISSGILHAIAIFRIFHEDTLSTILSVLGDEKNILDDAQLNILFNDLAVLGGLFLEDTTLTQLARAIVIRYANQFRTKLQTSMFTGLDVEPVVRLLYLIAVLNMFFVDEVRYFLVCTRFLGTPKNLCDSVDLKEKLRIVLTAFCGEAAKSNVFPSLLCDLAVIGGFSMCKIKVGGFYVRLPEPLKVSVIEMEVLDMIKTMTGVDSLDFFAISPRSGIRSHIVVNKKVAVRIHSASEYLHDGVTLLGPYLLSERLLRYDGFEVVALNLREVWHGETDASKRSYLEHVLLL